MRHHANIDYHIESGIHNKWFRVLESKPGNRITADRDILWLRQWIGEELFIVTAYANNHILDRGGACEIKTKSGRVLRAGHHESFPYFKGRITLVANSLFDMYFEFVGYTSPVTGEWIKEWPGLYSSNKNLG